MQATTKSLLMLLSMLVLGAVLGAAGMVGLRRGPPGPMPPEARPGGFVAHLEQEIQPNDPAQRAAIRPILEATDLRNRAAVDASRKAMRDNLDSMQVALSPLLDPEQRERLADLVRRLNDPRPGGRTPPR